MRYDDRLATVLRLTPAGQNVARIQMRQLLDLLGTSPPEARGELLDAAYLRLGELSKNIPAADRAAMLIQPGVRLRSPRLVATLAHGEPVVASAALAGASLGEAEWLDLIPALPVQARGLIRDNRELPPAALALADRLGIGERGLPSPHAPQAKALEEPGTAPQAPLAKVKSQKPKASGPKPASKPSLDASAATVIAATAVTEATPEANAGIGAIVRRIEAFRRSREEAGYVLPGNKGDAPQLPLGGEQADASARQIEQFDFATDTEGRIIWSEAMVAPMVVGTKLGFTSAMAHAIRFHQPLQGMRLDLAGAPAIAGHWQIDAAPRFDTHGGRFTGYVGRFRRPLAAVAGASQPAADSEAERLRQLLHELRTPVNAIQGFAEIIQQQLFGPAPHEYRALAANIAADAARMLAGFEELERYARLDSGAMELTAGECDLAGVVTATIVRLEPHTAPRHAGFAFAPPALPMLVPLAPIEAERLCWRLLAVLAAMAEAGEALELSLSRDNDQVVLAMQLPKAEAQLDDEALFHAATGPVAEAPQAGMFGTGFTLRLARAELRSLGGALERREDRLFARLPGLTQNAVNHSDSAPEQKMTSPVV